MKNRIKTQTSPELTKLPCAPDLNHRKAQRHPPGDIQEEWYPEPARIHQCEGSLRRPGLPMDCHGYGAVSPHSADWTAIALVPCPLTVRTGLPSPRCCVPSQCRLDCHHHGAVSPHSTPSTGWASAAHLDDVSPLIASLRVQISHLPHVPLSAEQCHPAAHHSW